MRVAQPQGDPFGFPLTLQPRWSWRRLALFPIQRCLQALGDQTLPQVFDRLHATMERFGNGWMRDKDYFGAPLAPEIAFLIASGSSGLAMPRAPRPSASIR